MRVTFFFEVFLKPAGNWFFRMDGQTEADRRSDKHTHTNMLTVSVLKRIWVRA